MLKIQEFIQSHSNWYELLQQPPYCLKISEDDGFYLFKYNQLSSDFGEEICCEARGIILDSRDGFRVVRMAFKKFFNVGEPHAAAIDWDHAYATEKIDGSLMSLWYARGEWHLSTNGTIDAYKATLGDGSVIKTFGELFDIAYKNITDMDNYNLFNKKKCYTFELVSPWNRIVINYPEPKIYLLSARDMETLQEAIIPVRFLPEIPRPTYYPVQSLMDCNAIVQKMSDEQEGIVVKDAQGNRVKIKTASYIHLHHVANNGVLTLERAIDIIKANEADEFLAYFSQYTNYFDSIRAVLSDNSKNLSQIKFEVECWKIKNPEKSKKDFALHIKNSKNSAYRFACYDNKEQQFIDSLPTKKFIKMFEIDKQIKKEF